MHLRCRIPTDPEDLGAHGAIARAMAYIARELSAGRMPSAVRIWCQLLIALHLIDAGKPRIPGPRRLAGRPPVAAERGGSR